MIPGRRQQGSRGSANRERCNGYLMTAYAAVVDSTFYRVRHGFAAINNAITANYHAHARREALGGLVSVGLTEAARAAGAVSFPT
jgi:hypothetical protein